MKLYTKLYGNYKIYVGLILCSSFALFSYIFCCFTFLDVHVRNYNYCGLPQHSEACMLVQEKAKENRKDKSNHTTPLNLFTGGSLWPRPCTSKCHAKQHVLNMHLKVLTISTHTPTHCFFLHPQPICAIHLHHHHHNHLYLFRHLTYFQFNTRQSACNPVAKCPYLLSRAFSPLLLTINTHNLSGFPHPSSIVL